MNRIKTREVIDKLGIRVLESDGLGILIERYSNATGYERWRAHTGGGIAGNSDKVWLSPVSRGSGREPRGPFWNKSQLEKALRTWRSELKPIGWRTEKRRAAANDPGQPQPPDPQKS